MKIAIDIFGAVADPTRLRIVMLVREMELSVGELAQVLGQSQPRVSRHVKILGDAGLVDRRKEGAWVFVRLGDEDRTGPVLDIVDRWAVGAEQRWFMADSARLAAVRADRASAAEQYFSQRAESWDAIRSLHVADTEVEGAIERALGTAPLGRLLDIGTGTGRMIELLAPRAVSASGVDRSSEMLRLARARLDAAGLSRATVRQADMYALDLPDGSADTVILHQVLHYAQQPAAVITEAARVMAPDARLLVVDFAPHEREELRSRDAHVRLGFADDEIAGWAEAAGLTVNPPQHLTGGALTVGLWLSRKSQHQEPI